MERALGKRCEPEKDHGFFLDDCSDPRFWGTPDLARDCLNWWGQGCVCVLGVLGVRH